MLKPESPLGRLLGAPMRPGVVTWIGLRPRRHKAMIAVDSATLDLVDGLVGDHYRSRTTGSRHLTLIEAEHLATIASHLGLERLAPEQIRRNVVVRGLNLLALKDRQFRLGEAVLAFTGECHPCSRMETILGVGGYNAVRGNGGVTARILVGGRFSVGDAIARVDDGA